jgi:hypothetical protein
VLPLVLSSRAELHFQAEEQVERDKSTAKALRRWFKVKLTPSPITTGNG